MPSGPEEFNTAVRELIEVARTCDLDDVSDLAATTTALRALTAGLRPHVVDGIRMQAALRYDDDVVASVPAHAAAAGRDVDEYARHGIHDPNDFFPYSPVVGPLNPLAPPDAPAGRGLSASADRECVRRPVGRAPKRR